MSIVSVVKTPPGPKWPEVDKAVRTAVSLVGGIPCKPGDLVLVKPNLVCVPPRSDSGAITRVEVARSVADIVRDMGANPVIAESAGVGADTPDVIAFAGYDALVSQGYSVIDLKGTPSVEISLEAVPDLKKVRIFRLALEADLIISVPVMKTHDQSETTLALKNLKGLVSDTSKIAMHRYRLFEGVAALAQALGPVFSVMDAITGQEGMGPVYGDPVSMNLILSSPDPVAIDATAGRIMGFEPPETPITMEAAKRGLGVIDPEVVGEDIPSVARRFKRASEAGLEALPENAVIFGEEACTGCRNTILAVIWQLRNEGNLHLLEGRTLVAGNAGRTASNPVLIGRCAIKDQKEGLTVPGCPPENRQIVIRLSR